MTGPHKILFLTRESHPSFRPDLVDLFGKHLPALGVLSDIFAVGDPSSPWAGGRAVVRPARGGISKQLVRFTLIADLYYAARAGCSAIQVRDRVLGGILAMMVAKLLRKPFFYWASFPFPEAWLDTQMSSSGLFRVAYWKFRGAITYPLFYGLICRFADHVFVQSDAMLEDMAAKGVERDRMSAVPMGVDLPEHLEAIPPHDDRRLEGRQVVVYLGALERIRHPEIMVHSMRRVIERFPDAVLCLVGDSQTAGDRAWLESVIDECDLRGNVFITGWVRPEEARRYLRAAKIGVSPFPRTPILEVASPTKVCEYLGYGLPVIANDQPDQAWLIEKTGGGVCVPLSAEGFADGICQLLADPEKATEMARRGRARVAELRGYPVIARKLAQTYGRLLCRSEIT